MTLPTNYADGQTIHGTDVDSWTTAINRANTLNPRLTGNGVLKNVIPPSYTQALSATTYVMSIITPPIVIFTGTTQSQTVALPATATVGQQWLIMNMGTTGAVTCNGSTSGTPVVIAGGTAAVLTATSATPTTASGWDVQYGAVAVTSGKILTVNNSLTLTGADGASINLSNLTGRTFAFFGG